MTAWNAHHRSGAAYSNDTAIKRAKQELPADAREIWSAQKGHCYQVELTSTTVGHVLAAPAAGDPGGGDPDGGVLAMISTLLPDRATAYRPAGVNQIMLSPGSYPAAADAPDC
jgi:hypothetical protein